jgi:DNA-binding transcriptional LysR family regulator
MKQTTLREERRNCAAIYALPLSTSSGVREVIPRIGRFMSAHPALHVDLRMVDDRQDLIVEGVDAAFRFGQLKDSNATSTMLGSCPRMLVASPDYLANAGMPAGRAGRSGRSYLRL